MSKKYYYIANWKMYWNFTQTVKFVSQNYDGFIELCQNQQTTIILCPSTPALHSLAQTFAPTDIALGGQDCSERQAGAYTGQVSAQHLQTAGATHCIVGHSERRKYNAETDTLVANKCLALLQAGLTPIICIGETLEQNGQNKTLSVLEAQLEPVARMVRQAQDERVATCARGEASTLLGPKGPSSTEVEEFTHEPCRRVEPFEHGLKKIPAVPQQTILIAYEPVWAIGTGLTPTPEQLQSIFTWLSDFVTKNLSGTPCSLIYGGSTASKNIRELKKVDLIDGFLIGGASLDFDEFAKIVKSSTSDSL